MPKFRHGAIHEPDNPAMANAIDFNAVRVHGVTAPVNWYDAWQWQVEPDLDVLKNDELSCCCEVADIRLIQAWLASEGIAWSVPVELVLLRYEAVGGYQGTPETDLGTITQIDVFGWDSVPIVAADREWNIKWLTVQPFDASGALKRGPLLATLGLPANDSDDPQLWHKAPQGPPVDFHRVVVGAERNGLLDVHSYGRRYLVHPARLVGCDLLLRTDQADDLRTAGVDWSALTA